MAFYLGVYSKNGWVEEQDVQAAIEDFRYDGNRKVNCIKHPGFHLYYLQEFDKSVLANDSYTTCLSGWLHPKAAGKKNLEDLVKSIQPALEANPQLTLSESEGAFALIQYNMQKHQLYLANDKFGMIPLFIFENKDYVVFSNEYEPLCKLDGAADLNYDAIAEFFVLGATLGSKTFFKQIQNLAPAHLFQSNRSDTQVDAYWAPNSAVDHRNMDVLAKETWDLFTEVNQETFSSGLIEVTLLTAGADSRLIFSTLTEEQRKNAVFYTSNLSFLKEDEDKDAVGAKWLVQKFGLRHRLEKISFYEDIFGRAYFQQWRNVRKSQVYGGWHGGEFLGGFCLKAAPVKSDMDVAILQQKLKTTFSRRFRRKLSKNVFAEYMQTKEGGTLFNMQQFSQSFFSSIYSGSRGHWLQPYQLSNHGYSPFWDSRIIQKVLTVPLQQLANYEFYNEVFKNADKGFLEIGSNSPLTDRSDSVIPPLKLGVEPKLQLPDVHHPAYLKCLDNPKIWDRRFYKKKNLRKILENENDAISKRWLDFEVWLTEYMGL